MHTKKGSSLIEVIVVASIFATAFISFESTFIGLSKFHNRNTLQIKGQLLAEEGIEIIRYLRDSGWSSFSSIPLDTDYYFSLQIASWTATSTPEVVDGVFHRHFKLSEVQRSSLLPSGPIVSSGGIIDPNTRKATLDVSWLWQDATSTIHYETYVIKL
jgi:hypothetical protein